MDAVIASPVKAARSLDRADFIWGASITTLAVLGGESALIAVCIALPALPSRCDALPRFALLITATLAYALGPTSLVFAVPLALTLSGARTTAARALISITAALLLAHHFETLPAVSWATMPPGSTGFIVIPALVVAVTFGPVSGWRAITALALGTLATLVLVDAGAGRWFSYAIFTSPVFRLMIAILPAAAASTQFQFHQEESRDPGFLAVGVVVGTLIALLLPMRSVSSIVFDESHGKWETVQSRFGPNDFGRVVNYTYGLLFKYAERVVGTSTIFEDETAPLPDTNAIFILKMPVKPLSQTFADRLEDWVRDGGRLMVVADHTDLYDTTQHLNAFLTPRFSLRLNPDAVYDHTGMPTAPETERFASLFGRIDAYGRSFPWQTGTSLADMPANTVGLATFGPSFSEPGDYSRQNRFGPFVPRASLRFTNHVAVAAFSIDRGAVAVVLDSTPWSNFSLFKEPHRQLFRGIVHTLERPVALLVWGWCAILLGGVALVSALWRHPGLFAVGGVAIGLTLGASAQIGQTAHTPPMEGRDFALRVVAGKAARLEFLKQLIGPGERNYSRIVSALAKYEFDPIASGTGGEIIPLSKAKRWLLLEPDTRQLPGFDTLVAHLQRGGDLTVLFAPDQAADAGVRDWLASLGLYAQKTVGLAVAEDALPGLLNRRGPAILRDVRAVTGALPSSLLKNWETDPLIQSYTVRPTNLPRSSGLLNIGFSADQFSDDAVGEVWEGIQPSSIGRHRERQLASALAGEGLLKPFPDDLIAPSTSTAITASLPAYVLLNNGKTVLSGRFDEAKTHASLSPSVTPIGYLANLRQHTLAFINATCPKDGPTTTCKKRLLAPDTIEWMVTWASDDSGRIVAAELLHERRFSGVGSTINVVFGQ